MRARRFVAAAFTGVAAYALTLSPAAAASDNIIVTYAGSGNPGDSGDGGLAISAELTLPAGVVLDNAANVFVADTENDRVRKVTADGIITTVAGTGTAGFSGDGGPATAARLDSPTALAIDAAGTLFIADTANHRVRKVNPQGVITTVAGTGKAGFSGNQGPAKSAELDRPQGLAVDGAGNLFIADTGNDVVRQVLPGGRIVPFAGTTEGFSGNDGPAKSAQLNHPVGLGLLGSTLLIADAGNNQVRKVVGSRISAFAGTGQNGFSGDGGPATAARLKAPTGVAADPLGNVYIVDTADVRIREVTADGIISTFAGTGVRGFSGDGGPAELAQIAPKGGVSTDGENVFFADRFNNRVRRIHQGGPPPALPEAPLANVLLAGSALVVLGGGALVTTRRRTRTRSALA